MVQLHSCVSTTFSLLFVSTKYTIFLMLLVVKVYSFAIIVLSLKRSTEGYRNTVSDVYLMQYLKHPDTGESCIAKIKSLRL